MGHKARSSVATKDYARNGMISKKVLASAVHGSDQRQSSEEGIS